MVAVYPEMVETRVFNLVCRVLVSCFTSAFRPSCWAEMVGTDPAVPVGRPTPSRVVTRPVRESIMVLSCASVYGVVDILSSIPFLFTDERVRLLDLRTCAR